MLRVELRRTGGFAGAELRVSLNTAQLPPAAAQRLTTLVDALGPPGATGSGGTGPPAMPDAMRYELVIERDGQRWHRVYVEPAVPPAVRPLLQELVAAAKRH